MNIYNKHKCIRYLAIVLVIILAIPTNTSAVSDDQWSSRASNYLTSYSTYIYFNVTGVNYMDEIGSLNIKIYESTDKESWSLVKTYSHDSSSGMLGSNDYYHSGSVSYQGTIGRYYKAYVCIWAGKDGSGDTRFLWTNVVKATLLAG